MFLSLEIPPPLQNQSQQIPQSTWPNSQQSSSQSQGNSWKVTHNHEHIFRQRLILYQNLYKVYTLLTGEWYSSYQKKCFCYNAHSPSALPVEALYIKSPHIDNSLQECETKRVLYVIPSLCVTVCPLQH